MKIGRINRVGRDKSGQAMGAINRAPTCGMLQGENLPGAVYEGSLQRGQLPIGWRWLVCPLPSMPRYVSPHHSIKYLPDHQTLPGSTLHRPNLVSLRRSDQDLYSKVAQVQR